MKLRIALILLIILSLFVELLLISFPLLFLFTYILFSIENRLRILIPILIISLIGDAVLVNPIGVTALSASLSVFMVFLYSRFLGSKDTLVYILIGVIGIFIYAIILGYSVESLVNWIIFTLVVFIIYKIISRKYL